MIKLKVVLSFVTFAVMSLGNFAFATNSCQPPSSCKPNRKQYILNLATPLPSDARIMRNGAHGNCAVGADLDSISYTRANRSFRGVDDCTVGYTTPQGAFCEQGIVIDFSKGCPKLQFSGTLACY
jgi:hypothetical protein